MPLFKQASKDLATKARIAEQAERYEDMLDCVCQIAKLEPKELDQEHRNLLAVAFKNVVGARRHSWRELALDYKQRAASHDHVGAEVLKEYTKGVEYELEGLCGKLFDLLDDHLMPKVDHVDARVFYLKADYNRYLSEIVARDRAKSKAAQKAANSYSNALAAAQALPATNPIRLGLALNYSVFTYEILGAHAKATTIAKEAFDQAIDGIEDVSDDDYKNASLVMQLIRDNLTLWTSERGSKAAKK